MFDQEQTIETLNSLQRDLEIIKEGILKGSPSVVHNYTFPKEMDKEGLRQKDDEEIKKGFDEIELINCQSKEVHGAPDKKKTISITVKDVTAGQTVTVFSGNGIGDPPPANIGKKWKKADDGNSEWVKQKAGEKLLIHIQGATAPQKILYRFNMATSD